jgi:hypothetical protein
MNCARTGKTRPPVTGKQTGKEFRPYQGSKQGKNSAYEKIEATNGHEIESGQTLTRRDRIRVVKIDAHEIISFCR